MARIPFTKINSRIARISLPTLMGSYSTKRTNTADRTSSLALVRARIDFSTWGIWIRFYGDFRHDFCGSFVSPHIVPDCYFFFSRLFSMRFKRLPNGAWLRATTSGMTLGNTMMRQVDAASNIPIRNMTYLT